MDKAELAISYFKDGYNCAQSVVMAYAEEMGLTLSQAEAIAGGFGGGIGGLRDKCGAFSGMVIVAGGLRGYDKNNAQSKTEYYALIRRLAEKFTDRVGDLNCGTILRSVKVLVQTDPSPRSEQYYATRPCVRLVEIACEILEETL